MHAHIHTCMHTGKIEAKVEYKARSGKQYIHACIYTYMHAYIHTYMHTGKIGAKVEYKERSGRHHVTLVDKVRMLHIYVCIRLYMYVCTYVCMYVCMYVYIYIYMIGVYKERARGSSCHTSVQGKGVYAYICMYVVCLLHAQLYIQIYVITHGCMCVCISCHTLRKDKGVYADLCLCVPGEDSTVWPARN
jgi:hypothetical protein